MKRKKSDTAAKPEASAKPVAKSYHKMSIEEKERHTRPHEPPIRCPACNTGLQPEDLLSHLERCEGRPAPHKLAKWVTGADAAKWGVTRAKLRAMVRRGMVRSCLKSGEYKYLMRDLVRAIAQEIVEKRWKESP